MRSGVNAQRTPSTVQPATAKKRTKDPSATKRRLRFMPTRLTRPASSSQAASRRLEVWLAVPAVDPELLEGRVHDPFRPRTLLQRDHVARSELQGRPVVDLKLPAALEDEQGFVRDKLYFDDFPGNRSWLPEPCLHGLVGTKQVDETARLFVVLPAVRIETGDGHVAASLRHLLMQVSEHREHAAVILGRGGQAQLPEDARHVFLDGAVGDDEALGDP
jgi:hypothetical protein